jgi:hypothetical protein
MPGLVGLLLLALSADAAPQEVAAVPQNSGTESNVEWAIGLGGRFERLSEPIVATYALGRLGEIVCAKTRPPAPSYFGAP